MTEKSGRVRRGRKLNRNRSVRAVDCSNHTQLCSKGTVPFDCHMQRALNNRS